LDFVAVIAAVTAKALEFRLNDAGRSACSGGIYRATVAQSDRSEGAVEFRVLGPLEASQNGRLVPLGGAKQRALLATLLVRANRVVSTDALLDELWGDRPPESAANMVQGYVSRLRKLLSSGNGDVIVHRPPGYVLRVEAERVDSHRFEQLVREATKARANGEIETAGAMLREALSLWRGAALADVELNSFVELELRRLEELRLLATEERIEVDLQLGRDAEVVPELEALVAEHPLRERLRRELMLALYRCGRQSEALEVYRDGRRQLVEGLGIEPGPPLRELERAILEQDPSLKATLPLLTEAPVPAVAGSRRRRRGLLLATAVFAIGGALAVAAVSLTGGGSSLTVPPNAVAAIDPSTNRVTEAVRVGSNPSGVAFGEGVVWVANLDDKTVFRFNPRTHEERTIPVDGTPAGIAAGLGAVWVAHRVGTLERIDPRYIQPSDRIRVLGPSAIHLLAIDIGSVGIGPRAVWVVYGDSTVAKIDPRGDRVSATGLAGNGPSGIAVGEGAVWVANEAGNDVSKLDPRTAKAATRTPIKVGNSPSAITVGGGAVWTADRFSDQVTRIDPLRNSTTSIPVGGGPDAIAYDYGSVWVANGKDGTVSRIDPLTRVVTTIKVGNSPAGIAVGAGRVWVTVQRA
jgi:YVTN family beta-propeller protein